jgi:hypothetical protein
MQNQPKHSGNGETQSQSLRSVAGVWCVTLLILTMGAGLTHVVGSAQAGASSIHLHLGR